MNPREILCDMAFFKDFSSEQIDRLIEFGSWVKAGRGERIITEGEADFYLYVLIKGSVAVVKNGKTLATLSPGDTFGEIGALTGETRTAHVMAREECYCLRMAPARIEALEVELQLKLVKKILFTMSRRLAQTNRRLVVA